MKTWLSAALFSLPETTNSRGSEEEEEEEQGDEEGRSECSPGAPSTSCADEKIGGKGTTWLLEIGFRFFFFFVVPLSSPPLVRHFRRCLVMPGLNIQLLPQTVYRASGPTPTGIKPKKKRKKCMLWIKPAPAMLTTLEGIVPE